MLKRPLASIVLPAVLLALLPHRLSCAPPQGPAVQADAGSVVCTVMEAFEDSKLGVRAVIFHQRDKADGPRLGALLLAHSGEEEELQVTGGQPYRATVFRVKSAFGRGLVLLPASSLKLAAHDQFTLRLPETH